MIDKSFCCNGKAAFFLSAIAALRQKGANEQFYVLGRREKGTS